MARFCRVAGLRGSWWSAGARFVVELHPADYPLLRLSGDPTTLQGKVRPMAAYTSVFTQITKAAQGDGSLLVYGKATGSDLDLDQQRMEAGWLRKAMTEFMRIGNIREQHDSKRAVGKAIEHEEKPDGHYIRAHIVDPVAVAKTNAGIFTGFSVGISKPVITKSADAPNGLISGGSICEISLVDRPCLPTATMTVCKVAETALSKASHYRRLADEVSDPNLRAGYRLLAKELDEALTAPGCGCDPSVCACGPDGCGAGCDCAGCEADSCEKAAWSTTDLVLRAGYLARRRAA